jgi:LysM repeat protein
MLENVPQVPILRTNVRNKDSNREGRKMLAVGNYRLVNPGRLLRVLAVLLLAMLLSLVGISGSVATSAEPQELVYVTVSQGDSLWSLADQHAVGDPRDWIAEVVLLNALESSNLIPGQQIALP